MPPSSNVSGKVWVLALDRSRALAAWWAGLHLLLVAAVLLAPAPGLVVGAALVAIALHAWRRYPETPGLLIVSDTGSWSVPERGLHGLGLGRGTSYSPWWAWLVLVGPAQATRALVLRDQLDADSWRRLTLSIRECRNAVD